MDLKATKFQCLVETLGKEKLNDLVEAYIISSSMVGCNSQGKMTIGFINSPHALFTKFN